MFGDRRNRAGIGAVGHLQSLSGRSEDHVRRAGKTGKSKRIKHMTFYEAAKLAKDAEAAEMWLTHFSPSLVGPQRYMDEVQKIFPAAELGKDGRSVELLFEEETKNE